MRYLIYNTLTEDEFNSMHKEIEAIQSSLEMLLGQHDFVITNRADLLEILGLDFVSSKGKYDGNIGFLYNDDMNKTFNLYVAKSYDVDFTRYFYKTELKKNIQLRDLIENHLTYFQEAIGIYQKIKDSELDQKIQLRKN